MSLFVYNLLRSAGNDGKAMADMKRIAVVIPYMLMLFDFYVKRPKVDLVSSFYKEKDLDAPLDVFLVDGFPQ